MVRHYGRSPCSERLVAGVPHGHWKTLTLVAALRIDRMTAPYAITISLQRIPKRAGAAAHLSTCYAHVGPARLLIISITSTCGWLGTPPTLSSRLAAGF